MSTTSIEKHTGHAGASRWHHLSLVGLVGIFVADFFTPLGFAHGTLYVPLVVLAGLGRSRRLVIAMAVAASLLTAIGALFSPPGFDLVYVVLNRLFSIGAIAVGGVLTVLALRHLEEMTDIHARLARSKAEVEEKNRLLEIASEVAHIGGWILDLQTKALHWSDEVCRFHGVPPGYTPTLEEGLQFTSPDHEDTRDKIRQCIEKGDDFDMEGEIIDRQGERHWVRSIGVPVRDDSGNVVRYQGAFQDITRQKTDEITLLESRRQFQVVANAIPQVIWTAGPDGIVDFVNKALFHYTGTPVPESRPGQEWLKAQHPDDRDQTMRRWEQAVATGSAHSTEFRMMRHDGKYRWHQVDAVPVRNDDGQIVKWCGTCIDIDDRVRLEKRSHRLARRLAVTLESITDGFIMFDREWHYTYINSEAERLMGRPREELLGKAAPDVFEQLPLLKEPYARALMDGEQVSIETYYPPFDTWFELHAYPSEQGLALYFRDISERKRNEARLRESEQRFERVATATSDAIWEWDLETGSLWWSEGLTALFGYAPGDIADLAAWADRIHPEDREFVMKDIGRFVETPDASHWRQDYRFLRKDGSVARVVDRGSLIRDDNGKAVRMVGGISDITERHEMSVQLQRSQRLEAVGQLTGGVAHDFNNLLTVILGNAELLETELGGDKRLQALAQMTRAAADRGAALTHRLLAFARRQPLEPRNLDVNRLVADMDSLLRRTLGADIDMELVRGGGLWHARVDPVQLEAALLNLCLNARDAMPNGGRLTIETANVRLGHDYARSHTDAEPGRYVMVAVSDTGTGIAPEHLSKVFDPFFTTKKAGRGSGLGLSMVYGFIKQSRGHVEVYSEEEQGTTVKMYLPLAEGPDIDEETEPQQQKVVGGGETILLVEDDDLVRDYAQNQLQDMGYRVISAADGRQALDALRTTSGIDLLFTDVIMPGGINGPELAERARQLSPPIKVLYTSGYTENAIVHHGRLDPGVHLLGKPYKRAELAEKIRAVLAES
jgi:PAS domain S-box-containing protein